MATLQTLHTTQASNWKRALKHKSGVVVYVSKSKSSTSTGRGQKGAHSAPVFKGEHEIRGFGPAAVFGVVGTRKLWDDWCVVLLHTGVLKDRTDALGPAGTRFAPATFLSRELGTDPLRRVAGRKPRREPLRHLVSDLHVHEGNRRHLVRTALLLL